MTPKAKSNFIQSVDRALQIMEVFSSEKRELGVTEIAQSLGIHKSTVFGLLATLENRGYVEQNLENGKYKLGLKLFELGNLVQEGMDLRSLAAPFIAELVDKYGETVHLVIHDKGEVVYIDKRESLSNIRILSRVGSRLPMHCTGVGKCLLAFMAEEDIQLVIKKGLRPFTPNTIIDAEKLKQELATIRNNGYAFDLEEIEMGLRCVAAPIKNHKGEVIAAISLSGPSMRMDEEKMLQLIEPIKTAALKISRSLGFQK
ncbi:MAG: IclR family transcriptional regulator, regulon repressor [Clostridia bacterium]|jgi:DNA-binding IclR family transcriptional regulator|nr:IclR family transcriptional regulator, regulon repressor [Clostridia bacterium]MDN5322481.1 IclR family transcriptional regulator, regulon repressor [Clostridia bacterium]